jgi:HAMP domain-containing protein
MSTGDMPAYPGLPTEMELDRAARASEERNSRLSRAADRISAMEFTAEVNSGSVRATVDAAGSLQRIELNARGARLSAPGIVPLVTTCVRKAQASIAEGVRRVMAEEVGGEDAAVKFVVDSYQERFPAPQEEAEDDHAPPPAAPRRPARPSAADDDEPGGGILRPAWHAD